MIDNGVPGTLAKSAEGHDWKHKELMDAYPSTPDETTHKWLSDGLLSLASRWKHAIFCSTHKALITFDRHLWLVIGVSFATDLVLRLVMTKPSHVN